MLIMATFNFGSDSEVSYLMRKQGKSRFFFSQLHIFLWGFADRVSAEGIQHKVLCISFALEQV